MRVTDLALACTIASLLAPVCASAQSDATLVVRGRVVDARSTAPLPSVSVLLTAGTDTLGRAQTDSAGGFELAGARRGPAVVHFARVGFRADSLATEIDPSRQALLRVAMVPSTRLVVAALGATKDKSTSPIAGRVEQPARRRSNGAIYIDEQEIERRAPTRTSDLFRGMAGVTLADSGGITQIVSTRGAQADFTQMAVASAPTSGGGRGTGSGSAGSSGSAGPPAATATFGSSPSVRNCVLRIGMDGTLMDPSFAIDDVPVQSIRGIEVYLGASTVPIQFSGTGSGSPCGLVMVWSRTGGGSAW